MNEGIKIRAWDIKNKKMINDLICFYPPNSSNDSNNFLRNWDNLKDLIFMRYVGRKDCNGKEIYEGDIDGSDESNLTYVAYSNKFCGYGLKFLPINEKDEYYDNCIEWSKLNIIGNIYELEQDLKFNLNSTINFK